VGQQARRPMSALNMRTTPEIEGQVTRVSADVATDQRSGVHYYVVAISAPPDQVRRLRGARLRPGMPVEAFIQTRERTLLSFLTKPLADQIERAFRED
jgi:HlyD family secretion protein